MAQNAVNEYEAGLEIDFIPPLTWRPIPRDLVLTFMTQRRELPCAIGLAIDALIKETFKDNLGDLIEIPPDPFASIDLFAPSAGVAFEIKSTTKESFSLSSLELHDHEARVARGEKVMYVLAFAEPSNLRYYLIGIIDFEDLRPYIVESISSKKKNEYSSLTYFIRICDIRKFLKTL